MDVAIGVDIGGTKILTALVDEEGQVLESVQAASDTSDKEAMFKSVSDSIEQLFNLYDFPESDIPIGVGLPGLVDAENGIAIYQSNIPWENFPIKKRLRESFKNNKIVIDNDVAMAGYRASDTYGEKDTVTYITVSTGVACTTVIDDEIIRGNGFSGELGHFMVKHKGRYRRLESVVSGPGIRDTAREKYNDESLETKEVFELYYNNDKIAIKVIDEAAELFSQNIYSLIALIDPHKIVFGGSVIINNPQYLDLIKEKMKLFLLKEQEHILDSMHIIDDNGQQGVIGAALKAIHIN